jgi:hypothetical protein
MYSSTETEEELEQLFKAGINNGRDNEDKEETNQQDRKDKDENQTNDTSEETQQKSLLYDLREGVIRRSQVFSV